MRQNNTGPRGKSTTYTAPCLPPARPTLYVAMASASGQVELMDAGRGAPVAPTTPRDLRHVLREDTELIDLRARNLSEREVYASAEAIPRCAKLETWVQLR